MFCLNIKKKFLTFSIIFLISHIRDIVNVSEVCKQIS